MRSKFVSEAHRASAEATAYCAAAFSGTGSLSGFNRMASMLGNSRNMRRKAENSVAAPVPTAPAMTSCSTAGCDFESKDSRITCGEPSVPPNRKEKKCSGEHDTKEEV